MAEELEVRRSITVQRDAVCGGEGLEFGGGALMAEILRDGGKQILHRHGGAPAAEIRRYRCKVARHSRAEGRSVRHRRPAAAAFVRQPDVSADPRPFVEPHAEPAGLCLAVLSQATDIDRATAGGPVRAERPCTDIAEFPPLAHHRDGAGFAYHRRAISRP